jgi:hypothetical protein
MSKLPPDDLSDCTKEEIKVVREFEKELDKVKKKSKFLKLIEPENDLDKFVWDRLPLTDDQKEQMIFELFLKDNNINVE